MLAGKVEGPCHHLFFLELKQFNQGTRWIFQKPGATGSRLTDLSSKFDPSSVQPADETVYVVRNNHEPVPSTRLRIAASSSSTTRPWGAQVERQIVTIKRCKLARIVHVHRELQLIAIEFDRPINVRHNVSDGCHCPCSVFTAKIHGSTHGSGSRFNERGAFAMRSDRHERAVRNCDLAGVARKSSRGRRQDGARVRVYYSGRCTQNITVR